MAVGGTGSLPFFTTPCRELTFFCTLSPMMPGLAHSYVKYGAAVASVTSVAVGAAACMGVLVIGGVAGACLGGALGAFMAAGSMSIALWRSRSKSTAQPPPRAPRATSSSMGIAAF